MGVLLPLVALALEDETPDDFAEYSDTVTEATETETLTSSSSTWYVGKMLVLVVLVGLLVVYIKNHGQKKESNQKSMV